MTAPLSGPGLGLPIPQNLYPSELLGTAYDTSNGLIALAPGEALLIPRGSWFVEPGGFSTIQFLDPVQGFWRTIRAPRAQRVVTSDGNNVRIINPLGCVVTAVITGQGAGYTQAGTTITPKNGNSTWQPIVGGALAVGSITGAGAGFTLAPIVMIPGPPAQNAATGGVGGVQASAYAVLTSGTVSSVTLSNTGAGYTAATVTALMLPSPYDPNLGSITPGTVTFTTSASAGKLTAAICTDYGQVLTAFDSTGETLTVAGTHTTAATLAAVIMQTVASSTVGGAGAGFGTATLITSAGGVNTSVDATTNPNLSLTGFIPYPVQGYATIAGGTISALVLTDSGLFTAAPSPIVIPATGVAATTAATVTFTMGTKNDAVFIQPGA